MFATVSPAGPAPTTTTRVLYVAGAADGEGAEEPAGTAVGDGEEAAGDGAGWRRESPGSS